MIQLLFRKNVFVPLYVSRLSICPSLSYSPSSILLYLTCFDDLLLFKGDSMWILIANRPDLSYLKKKNYKMLFDKSQHDK